MTLNRAEENMTRQALGKSRENADKRRETRLSEAMGEEERISMESARRIAREGIRRRDMNEDIERLQMAKMLTDQKESGIAEERARCLAICAQWPDNLMAKHLAALIRGGK